MVLLINFTINTWVNYREETICLINSYLNYINNYVYTITIINKNGPLAQLVEQFPFKEWVDGSSPSRLTINISIYQNSYYEMFSGG